MFLETTRKNALKTWIGIFCACIVSLLAIQWAFVERIALPAAAQRIDLRQDQSQHHYSLVINMREAGAHGHVWATWVRHISDTDREVTSLGFFADGLDDITEVFDTEGVLQDESQLPMDPNTTTLFAMVFWLDEDQFIGSKKAIDQWQGQQRYEVFARDCVTFVQDIFDGLNVPIPNRQQAPTPWLYMAGFVDMHLWGQGLRIE